MKRQKRRNKTTARTTRGGERHRERQRKRAEKDERNMNNENKKQQMKLQNIIQRKQNKQKILRERVGGKDEGTCISRPNTSLTTTISLVRGLPGVGEAQCEEFLVGVDN